MQEASSQFQSQLADLKTRLEAQEAETRKADSKFKFSLHENEKLKTEFNTQKAAWAEEKAALIQRAEKAEASLEEVTTELTGLKHHINQMTFAIFGKIFYIVMTFHTSFYKRYGDLIIICHAGPRSSNLGKEMLI